MPYCKVLPCLSLYAVLSFIQYTGCKGLVVSLTQYIHQSPIYSNLVNIKPIFTLSTTIVKRLTTTFVKIKKTTHSAIKTIVLELLDIIHTYLFI